MRLLATFLFVTSITALPFSVHAYKFLCSGYTITGTNGYCPVGTLDQDTQCGCTLSTAPKWRNGAISFKAENQGGNGVSANTFVQAVRSAAQEWSNVSCSSMLTAFGGTISSTNSARWGNSNNLSNENGVFFVRSQAEWIEVTGSGAGSTLGVTVSPYSGWNCNSREFSDTDILINGFLEGGWNYENLQGTILHEMGHSIGLGHPCLTTNYNCNNSCSAVMAATGADFAIPQQDDVNAVCALYPGSSGGLGSACSGNWDCDSGTCITYEGFTYCSQSCSNGCPTGYECKTLSNQQVCVRKGLPDIGEACTSACVEGAICLGGEEGGLCYKECNVFGSNSECPANQNCVEVNTTAGSNKGICIEAAGPEGDCEVTDGVCVDGHVCVYGSSDGYRCRQECNPNASNNCPAGQRCFGLQDNSGQSNGGACFPGGTQGEGESCSSAMDCQAGLLCISTFGGAMCMWECDPQNPNCPYEGQTCDALSNGTGVCDPVGGGGSGGGTNNGGSSTPGQNGDQTSSGGNNSNGPMICSCDATTACDANCPCDPECVCDCDLTTACDDNCDCDPECTGIFGCSAVSTNIPSSVPSEFWLWGLGVAGVIWRRRQRQALG